jgi:hypothetical protein
LTILHILDWQQLGRVVITDFPQSKVLPWAQFDPQQQSRYKHDLMDCCRRVAVPFYGIFQDSEIAKGV